MSHHPRSDTANYLPHLSHRSDVDGLRAVAISAVVMFHTFPAWIGGGFFGVDIFFVISGYLITGLILKADKTSQTHPLALLSTFYARRIRRLFPALILVLLTCLLLGWFVMLADEYKQLGHQVIGGAAFIENLLLLGEVGYFDTAAEMKPLLHLWSLGVEEQFYLIWPVLLAICLRAKRNHIGVAIALLAVSFGANIIATKSYAAFAFYSPITRLWELMAGTLLAQREAHRLALLPAVAIINRGRNIASTLGAVSIGIGIFVADAHTAIPGWWALLPTLGTFFLIAAGPSAWINRYVLSQRPFVFLGLISYPLYLWHWPLLSFARLLSGAALGIPLGLSLMALALLLSCLTYWCVEKRIRVNRHWATTLGLACALLFVGAVGYNIYYRDGLEFRLKDSQLRRIKFNTSLYYQSRCREIYSFARSGFCLRSDYSRPPTVALVGDSHAMNLYVGLGRRYDRQGDNVVLFGNGGGITYYGVERIVNGRLTSHYAPQYAAILDDIVSEKNIKTVILMNKTLSVAASESPDVLRDPAHPSKVDTLQVYADAMRYTLRQLLDAGKEVVVVIDSPAMGFDPESCISRIAGISPERHLCAIPRQQYEQETGRYRQLIADVLAQYPTVKRWDLATHLCDEHYCWAMRDGKMLYARDGHHLTMEASYWLADRFNPQ